MRIEAVIFDMDGLLVDSEPTWRMVEIECFKEVGIELSEQQCMQTKGLRIDEVVDYWFQVNPWQGPEKPVLVKRIVDRMVEEMELHARALPGVQHTLEICERRKCKTAVASSSQLRLIQAVLKGIQVQSRFDVICSAENEAFGKPHPAVFLTAAKKLGIAPEKCLVLEDSVPGVIAAKAAKMKCLAVPDAHERENPQFSIADAIVDDLKAFTEAYLNK